MSLANKSLLRNATKILLLGLLLTSALQLSMIIDSVSAAQSGTYLKFQWKTSLGQYAKTKIGPLAADFLGDSKLEIATLGGPSDGATDGVVTVLDGVTGQIRWQKAPGGLGMHTGFEIADLDNDGGPDILIAGKGRFTALQGNDGSIYWQNRAVSTEVTYPAVADIDGDGYPEIFTSRGLTPEFGYDWIYELSHDGNILHQAYSWHPCYGGLTVGDTNSDGRFELYQGDRSNSYSPSYNNYKGGGMGLRALDAHTLKPLWNDPTILCSSQAPILADVDGNGVQDVIIADQGTNGIAVLNTADGSVVTTGGIYRKSGTNMPAHSQPTVADVDGDGHLEFISCALEGSYPKIWDLYEWRLDGTINVTCTEPPKVGDVTGDGKPDIIAVTYGAVYVYTYLNNGFAQVDYVSGLNQPNAFTLIQDVDGDSRNELIVTSAIGDVYCYDTPTQSPSPKMRTVNQFYSERRCGVAEYVPPPTPTRPVLIDEQPLDRSFNQEYDPTLSIKATSFQADKMNITFRTNSTGAWQDLYKYENVESGRYSINTTGMNEPGTKYYWNVIADDGQDIPTSRVYSFTTQSHPPTQTNPKLTNSSGGNLITYNQTTADADKDKVTNTYNWYLGNSSLSNLNLPFNTRTTDNPLAEDQLFGDGFENGLGSWDGNGVTDWSLDSSQKYSGTYSAHADSNSNYLASDDIDTSSAEGITVSIWYRDHGIDDDDNVYVQFWNGSTYINVFELGNSVPEDTWHWYTIQTYEPRYMRPDFNVRIDARSIDLGEELWIDDISVTTPSQTKDYSNYGNYGTLHGPTWTNEGIVGGAYSFDGINDFIRIPDDSTLGGDGSGSEISIEFWIKPAALMRGTRIIAKKVASASTGSYMIGFQSSGASPANTLFFGITSSSDNQWHEVSNTATAVLAKGVWHHVVCTYKSGPGLTIFIDGSERVNQVLTGTITPGPGESVYKQPLFIGYDGGGGSNRWLNGTLDEVRVYPRALSQSQILQRYIETSGTLSNSSTIVTQETSQGEIWTCQVTPNDSFSDGETKSSNSLTLFPTKLVIEVVGEGTTIPHAGSYIYYEGALVTVQAFADSGWIFDHWLLDGLDVGNSTSITVAMNSNRNLTAVMIVMPTQYSLLIGLVNNGTTNPPPGSYMYSEGSSILVTALPDQGWMLSHWLLNGSEAGNTNPYNLTINGNWNLTAVFARIEYTLTIAGTGNGSTNPSIGNYVLEEGARVSVYAYPDVGWILRRWVLNGSDVGSANPYNTTITGNFTLEAQFEIPPPKYELLIGVVNSGTTDPQEGSHIYDAGSNVSVTALPNSGWMLKHWLLNGSEAGNTNPYNLIMSGNWNLTAVFSEVVQLFKDDFESGDFVAWTGVSTTSGESASVVNGFAHCGNYGAEFASNGNSISEAVYCYKTIASSGELYARGYFNVAVSGLVDNDDRFYFIVFRADSNAVAYAGWRRTAGVTKWSLIIRDGTTYVNMYSIASPSIGQWYSVELHWKKDGTNGLGELWVNGTLICSISNRNTGAFGDANQIRFGLAELRHCAPTKAYGDCFIASKIYIGVESASAGVLSVSSSGTTIPILGENTIFSRNLLLFSVKQKRKE